VLITVLLLRYSWETIDPVPALLRESSNNIDTLPPRGTTYRKVCPSIPVCPPPLIVNRAIGAIAEAIVVKVTSEPKELPALFVATSLAWYVVLDKSPLRFDDVPRLEVPLPTD
jgi:hypothetical protein